MKLARDFQRVVARTLLTLAVLAGAGCMTLEQAAPPVALLHPQAGGGNLTSLALGRDIYVTKCAKCHSVEPVTNYSLAKWDEILPKMAEKTKLVTGEADAVRAYVFAVLKNSQRRT